MERDRKILQFRVERVAHPCLDVGRRHEREEAAKREEPRLKGAEREYQQHDGDELRMVARRERTVDDDPQHLRDDERRHAGRQRCKRADDKSRHSGSRELVEPRKRADSADLGSRWGVGHGCPVDWRGRQGDRRWLVAW